MPSALVIQKDSASTVTGTPSRQALALGIPDKVETWLLNKGLGSKICIVDSTSEYKKHSFCLPCSCWQMVQQPASGVKGPSASSWRSRQSGGSCVEQKTVITDKHHRQHIWIQGALTLSSMCNKMWSQRGQGLSAIIQNPGHCQTLNPAKTRKPLHQFPPMSVTAAEKTGNEWRPTIE